MRAHRKEGKRHAKTIDALRTALEAGLQTTSDGAEETVQLIRCNKEWMLKVNQLESQKAKEIAKLTLCIRKWVHRADQLKEQRDILRLQASHKDHRTDLAPSACAGGSPSSSPTSSPLQSPRTPGRFSPEPAQARWDPESA